MLWPAPAPPPPPDRGCGSRSCPLRFELLCRWFLPRPGRERCCCSAEKDFDWFEGVGARWLDFLPSLASELDKLDRKLEVPEGLSFPEPWGEKEGALTFIVAVDSMGRGSEQDSFYGVYW